MIKAENQKCMVSLHRGRRPNIEATLLGFVPAPETYRHQLIAGSDHETTYTVDALVRLKTFNQGGIYQLPIPLVRVVEKWDRELDDNR